MTYIGIDVSKATFVVAYSSAKTGRTKTFKNTVKGVREFIRTISATEHHCVLEAQAITARCSFTCFQKPELPSVLRIR